ncbi:MAG: hypothetical protein CML29_06235 [Rhizobiales bacterium]|nr:hypothetical protein [Hyphomicrobiales bacterium]MBA69380.1 hypothetical protein [Hyphomicrobiales bacterium]|tara:strand:+ start:2654 stop:4435 length:1782 start_codon:yes stop_codon:yes gene_type:complete
MQLIDEIEISYFRSFYKFKLRKLKDLNIIFGKNDSGKSNVVRALNLFFSEETDRNEPFEFEIDFSERRLAESEQSEDVRKFLYVKITFNTPKNYQTSLGKQFYVKRQWTVSRDYYNEEISSSIPNSRRHIATRFLNKIKFIYIPAIKDISIFEGLLGNIHETVASSTPFTGAVSEFSEKLQELTSQMFQSLPKEVSTSTKIGAPTQLSQLFQTLDFETRADGDVNPKSLIRQRGDGVKVRHIPELLKFISENDKFDYHIWGFEEPENSLDFVAAQSEALRLLSISKSDRVQIVMTTHSPSFYLLNDRSAEKYYVSKDNDGISKAIQGRELEKFDAAAAVGEGFYLPAVAEAVSKVATIEARVKAAEAEVSALRDELNNISTPVVLTEGRTDAKILLIAWEKIRGGTPPFAVRSCETGGPNAGSGNGGAYSLAVRLAGVAADHPHAVVGIFDYDSEGIKAYQLNKNFNEIEIAGHKVKKSIHGQAYATLLLPPTFREECGEYENLPIEFLFRDEHLAAEVDGQRLNLKRKKATTLIGTKRVERELEDVTHFKDVGAGKTQFANSIVPSLPPDAFDGFEAIFVCIEQIIEDSQSD